MKFDGKMYTGKDQKGVCLWEGNIKEPATGPF